jgi:hypothetical protein
LEEAVEAEMSVVTASAQTGAPAAAPAQNPGQDGMQHAVKGSRKSLIGKVREWLQRAN